MFETALPIANFLVLMTAHRWFIVEKPFDSIHFLLMEISECMISQR